MSARTTRAAARVQERSLLLSVPLRVAALSWGLSTLPLTVLLRLGGRVTRVLDTLLAVVGLTRQGRAAAQALAHENALRAQLRQTALRHKATLEQLERSEATRLELERELSLQRERAARAVPATAAPAPGGAKERSTLTQRAVQGALLQTLYASCLACAASVAALADVPHLSIERKLVTVGLVPAGLTFVSQVRNRTLLGSLLVISVNWLVTGFVLHLLLRRGHPGAAAAHGSPHLGA